MSRKDPAERKGIQWHLANEVRSYEFNPVVEVVGEEDPTPEFDDEPTVNPILLEISGLFEEAQHHVHADPRELLYGASDVIVVDDDPSRLFDESYGCFDSAGDLGRINMDYVAHETEEGPSGKRPDCIRTTRWFNARPKK